MAYIHQINAKPKTEGERGLPKKPIDSAIVKNAGIEGDYNNYRTAKKGATPDRALLIMPLSMLEQLNREGWPVKAGDIGENITLAGIDYSELRAGKRYQAGTAVIEITTKATPCKNLALLPYVGEERITEFMKTLVDRRGWYAKVLREGTLKTGMTLDEIAHKSDEWPTL